MPRYHSNTEIERLPRRTLDYLERGAPEGSRNAELFEAACQFRDAGFSDDEAEHTLLARALADGLPEGESRAAIRSAYRREPREAAGEGSSPSLPSRPAASAAKYTNAATKAAAKVIPLPRPLPEPEEDGFLKLLEAAFRPDEFVAIAPAAENEDGEIAPRSGVTLTMSQWRERVLAKGGIDRCFGTRLGLFVRINPMRRNGSKNEDVTAFRHVLVEFDAASDGSPLPKEIQHAAIVASGLPVTALIDSGNKSLHAWVRVEARDEAEYRRRVGKIWDWFEGHPLDRQNRNPSRLSRCPDGWRTVGGEPRQQRLLALGLGSSNWETWESEQTAGEAGEALRVSQLGTYDTGHDPNNVLGRRWLCRGGSLVVVGQSGIGKSSLCMQLMLLWALGRPAFGITPVRPLRSLLIQAENDLGDLAEMYQGVRSGMGLTPEEESLLEEQVLIFRDTTHSGEEFVTMAASLVDRHQPDLVWIDPLLNYIGDDISQQKVISEFCCRHLNAVSLRTGVIWCLMHHTGKPSKDPKATANWTASDLAYSGIGSSALTNWAREMAVLVRVNTEEGEPPTFQLSMTKRRLRAGLHDEDAEPTDTIFLRHAQGGGICWEQCEAPVEKPKTTYRKGRKSDFDPAAFHAAMEPFGGVLNRSNQDEAAAKLGVSVRTAWRWWNQFKNNDL
jgi:RecA-family ATPase